MANACTSGIDTGFAALGYFKVAILGIVQGITELMPISSTAHMRLVPAALGWQDPGSAFSASMQLAALAAVVSYFWTDVRDVTVNAIAATARRDFRDRYFQFAVWLVVATIPIGIAGLALAKVLNTCNSPLRAISVIGWSCMAMAALLAVAELAARHRRTIEQATMLDALLIGIAQVGALIPGVSRSGSTLTAALMLGFKRDEAARLSFLLGLPAIALAGAQGAVGTAQSSHRRSRVVGPACRHRGRIGLCVFRHLGADAHLGKFLELAVRRLSVSARCRHPRRYRIGMGCVTPATACPHDSPPGSAPDRSCRLAGMRAG